MQHLIKELLDRIEGDRIVETMGDRTMVCFCKGATKYRISYTITTPIVVVTKTINKRPRNKKYVLNCQDVVQEILDYVNK